MGALIFTPPPLSPPPCPRVAPNTGAFALQYSDLGNSVFLSAAQSEWTAKLPKWKFASQAGEDDKLSYDTGYDPIKGLAINKYSLWVAAAVNMGTISIADLTDLTDTSFASAYAAAIPEELVAAEDDDGGA